MKRAFMILLVVLTFSQLTFSQKPSSEISSISWEDIQVVYQLQDVEHMTQGERLTETIKTSLNFGTKSKVQKDCLKKLKQQAAEKGYSVLYVDEQASSNKRFNKRGIKVTLVGMGYKS